MEKTDKAVSTEDLCIESQSTMCLEAAKLEALFKTLVENKVEAIKNDKVKLSSVHSSPKSLVHRFRLTSSSSANSSKENHHYPNSPNRKHKRRKKGYDDEDLAPRDIKVAKRSVFSKTQVPSSSPESARHNLQRCCDRNFCSNEKPQNTLEFHCDSICSTDDFITSASNNYPCCCPNDRNGHINMHYNDYVSLKIEDFENIDEEAMMNREALRRARRKRRKRRKRRMKNHRIEITPLPVPEIVKELDPDELPQRARWTIVATACLLLFMCLLLVGVTLRMAPIIDDMVRKENEELMNSLHRSPAAGHQNLFNSSSSHVRKDN